MRRAFGEGSPVAGREIVEDSGLVAGGEQLFGYDAPDVPAPPVTRILRT